MKQLLLLIIITLLPIRSFAQLNDKEQAFVDSLKQVIETTKEDSVLVKTLFGYAFYLEENNPVASLENYDKAKQICESKIKNKELPLPINNKKFYEKWLAKTDMNIGYFKMIRGENKEAALYFASSIRYFESIKDLNSLPRLYGFHGWNYYAQLEYEEALIYYLKCKEAAKEAGAMDLQSQTFLAIGQIYLDKGDMAEAMNQYEQCLQLATEIGDKYSIGVGLQNIGGIHSRTGNVVSAIESYTQALKIFEELGNNYQTTNILSNIGHEYLQQDNYSKALDNFNRQLSLEKQLDNKTGVASVLNNIGQVYFSKGDLEKGFDYFNQSLKVSEEMEDKNGIITSHLSLGDYYKTKGNLKKALGNYNKGVEIIKETEQTINLDNFMNAIGDIYLIQQKYDEVIKVASGVLNRAKEMGDLNNQIGASNLLYQAYKETGKNRLALEMYEYYNIGKDSIQNKTNQKAILNQEYKYAYEKQALADSLEYAQEQILVQAELKSQKQQSYYLMAGLGMALLFGSFIFNRFRLTQKQKKIIEEQKQQVESEKEKSENLLLNILPKDTVEELKTKGSVSAQSYSMASVLFTDFKAFTALAGQMTPEELLAELNFCFSKFDEIMENHNVEKIKTIGDAYMAVSGVPIKKENHATDILNAALSIKTFMESYAVKRQQENKTYFEIRIGIHSGPLVAGVVGTKKFQYDLWGDTVNIASRMEANSEVGKVNISNDTYQLIKVKTSYQFIPRGKMSVKVKGELEMYFVD